MRVVHVDPVQPDPQALDEAAAVLQAAGLIVYPTDTLYALGGCALDAAAAAAVRAAKGRGDDKPLPLIAADLEQARALCAGWPLAADRVAAALWPGPVTLVLKASPAVPAEVTSGTSTVAVRVPAAAVARQLARRAGPLISTSANRSGGPAPLTCQEAVAAVGAAARLALDAGPGRAAASTIVDLTGPQPKLLRAGAVDFERVRRVAID